MVRPLVYLLSDLFPMESLEELNLKSGLLSPTNSSLKSLSDINSSGHASKNLCGKN